MKIENQVTSLELSKKLKELGVKQEILFYWAKYKRWNNKAVTENDDGEWYWILETHEFCCDCTCTDVGENRKISAFTVAELGEMLPGRVHTDRANNYAWELGKNAYDEYIVSYHNPFEAPLIKFMDKSEADARAKMLVYLLENKLI